MPVQFVCSLTLGDFLECGRRLAVNQYRKSSFYRLGQRVPEGENQLFSPREFRLSAVEPEVQFREFALEA